MELDWQVVDLPWLRAGKRETLCYESSKKYAPGGSTLEMGELVKAALPQVYSFRISK